MTFRGALGSMVAVLAIPSLLVFAQSSAPKTFATPEDAVRALIAAAAPSKTDDALIAIFGGDARELIASSDEGTTRQNLEIFRVAAKEGWRLVDQEGRKILIIGNEAWPFPVPIAKTGNGWSFDTAAGKEEVIVRRIGRNELAVIGVCHTYVMAQHDYAKTGHDGKPGGLFAMTIGSAPGKQNGLYWPVARHEAPSPLGDLLAQAAQSGQAASASAQPTPFHGYYFKILTGQGAAAAGGAKSYLVNGEMSGGFALVAWPAQYDASGVMTFIVNQDAIVHEKDLGPETATAAAAMSVYDPDASWHKVP